MNFSVTNAFSIQEEIYTDGHSPLLVIGADDKLYVAKNDKGKIPPTSLINECFAQFCLEHWNIAKTNFAFMTISRDLIEHSELSNNHKNFYYDTVCFASEFIDNPIDANELLVTHKKNVFTKINNPNDFLHIALFDTWVENDDRKPTNYNLVFKLENNKYTVIPIDHAFIFSTLKYQSLKPNLYTPIDNEHILISELGILIKKHININTEFINKEREYFYICIENCKCDFDKFIGQILNFYDLDNIDIEKLKLFLFDDSRNKKVFEEYVYRLNQ
jgi:hypothetical protein